MDMLFTFFAADFVGKPVWLWFTFIGLVMGMVGHALVPCARAHRVRRFDFRGGLGARRLRNHTRSIHRLHLEHLRDPGTARVVLRARRDDRTIPVPEVRARHRAHLHRQQDLCREYRRQDPSVDLTDGHSECAAWRVLYSLYRTRKSATLVHQEITP